MNTGGLEKQLVQMGAAIDQTCIQLDYTSDTDPCDFKQDILNSGCGFYYLPSTREVGILQYSKALYKLLKDNKYDVVHSHELFHSGLVLLIAALAGVPQRICHAHSTQDDSTYYSSVRKMYQVMMRFLILIFSTDLLACSTIAGVFLYGRNSTKDPRFRVIFNSVQTELFLSDLKAPAFSRKENWKYIVHVGRFVPLKNHQLMLDIAEIFKKQNKNICFVFVGDGPIYADVEERIRNRELQHYVMLLGLRRDVPEILKTADAFILPSKFEGMPLSVIEAQAAGLPCVIADHITDEVDFGLHLLLRCSLTEELTIWAAAVEKAVSMKHIGKGKRIQAISSLGFDVDDFSRKVGEVYGIKKA